MIDTALGVMLIALCIVIFAVALGIVALVGCAIIELVKIMLEE